MRKKINLSKSEKNTIILNAIIFVKGIPISMQDRDSQKSFYFTFGDNSEKQSIVVPFFVLLITNEFANNLWFN